MAKATTKAALAELGSNLAEESDPGIEPPALAKAKRVRIQLEDNPNISPSGQFFQVGGSDEDGNRFLHSYLLKPNVPADVPEDLIEVLNNALGSVPILDEQQSVVGYRDILRFPYRVLNSASSARA